MSDTDSIKTDRSQPDLQQKYDKLAMEYAKARMQLNVLKKAYTAKTSKLDQKSVSKESLDLCEHCKYETMSTNSLDLQEDFPKLSQNNSKVKATDVFKLKDVQLLKQDINTMNHHIHRVLESTKSNTLDYSLIMSEIENCKNVQKNCPNSFCETLNNELTTLKCSITTCLYNLLYNKLESRTKVNTQDSRLIYPNHYCLDNCYTTDEDRFQKVFITLVVHFFLSFVINLHGVIEYLLKEIKPDASILLQKNLKVLTNQLHSNSLILENILIYCDSLKSIEFDTQYILVENILLFTSNKYIELVKCIKVFIESDHDNVRIDCSSLRENVISFMTLKFPIEELMSAIEYQESSDVNVKLNSIYDSVHTLLRAINIFEFEYFYKNSQVDMHWHMKNPFLHIQHSKQTKEDLNSAPLSQNCYIKIVNVFNEKIKQEMKKSSNYAHQVTHWENKYNLLYKKHESITNKDKPSGNTGPYVVENQLGKCESSLNFNDEALAREKELRNYFEKKINDLISSNKELSGQTTAYSMEIIALKTRLDHNKFVRKELEVKLQDALEHIEELKEEFRLTSTNYETQLRAMTEHLASLNETVVLERRHIDDLNNQLKIKGDKKKSSK